MRWQPLSCIEIPLHALLLAPESTVHLFNLAAAQRTIAGPKDLFCLVPYAPRTVLSCMAMAACMWVMEGVQ